jgi:hypothetical protein
MDYHTRFTNLHDTAVQHVDDAAPMLWTQDSFSDACIIMKTLADNLASVYEMPAPSVEYNDREVYNHISETIGIPRPSLVSFLHEFRHHMQKYGRQANPDIEHDARGWSISMFATAEPEYFDRAWKAGRIMFMPAYQEVSG